MIGKEGFTYPFFRVQPGYDYIHDRLTSNYGRTAPLDHRDVVSVLIVILCDIMGRVATANDHGFFPLGIWLGFGELA